MSWWKYGPADGHGSILVKETDEWNAGHIPSEALKTCRLSMDPVDHILQAIVNSPTSGATAISEPDLKYVVTITDWKQQLTDFFSGDLRPHVDAIGRSRQQNQAC